MEKREDEIPCTKDHKIRCTYKNRDAVICDAVVFVRDLRLEPGPKLQNPKKDHSFHHTMYYYCPACSDPLAKVFDWGDGRPLVLAANVELVSVMSEVELLEMANKIIEPYGLRAEFLGDVHSVGVGGDCRTYTRVMVLIGSYPGNEILASLSTKLGNTTGINRITFELAKEN
ncbi:MAG: hypothetical protein A3A98_02885 [Candidatus Staskawiczbacteria bacterium RIFCSPLOWO2_01_FULL_40_39]|uniref:Uncharacterized protein n=1 Tax=Candidatus Staskawiczbacteria bacterium RIFCSPHIGHO2_01_FULL_39_25 TaxID=1802202 RepID=A0A1G2HM44_9BACT|nr:MAG: hypothetical protein A2730_03535 [Candidatus Staskawiczbacteria bacterium RIFCSPHIGHO2_01_FULL_39_25]OGZ73693.1 MAG: hypothetical protein A3A98_02885 [Candidatus Staskawiczbacteria bacterium RIFCSPLOWO2_01_FULL_40_39]